MNKLSMVLFLSGLLFIFLQFVVKYNTDSTEKESYKVLKKYKEFEIRKYSEMYVASTLMRSSGYENNSSTGFRRIAGYIFGNNEDNQKIAMTSPVIMEMKDSVEMSFIMPEGVTSSNAPAPSDQRVELKMRAEETLAVIRFGGWANSKKIEAKKKELISYLSKHKIDYFGETIYMGYNPPYQVIDRRNEIAIRVNYSK